MVQGTREWKESRLGCFTGSEIEKIMKPKGFGDTGNGYVYSKVAEALTGESPEEIYCKQFEYGKELEPFAVEHYEKAFGIKTCNVGFVKNEKFSKECGASPDRIIPSIKKIVEIKCPMLSANHIKYMVNIKDAESLKKFSKIYYWQVQMEIFCTGYNSCDFVSYDPRFYGSQMMYVAEILPVPEDQELLKDRLKQAIKMKNEIINKIKLL